jgi:hypothetical protein
MLISMRRLFFYCCALLVIQGCIATSPIPNTVRTGDYVTLGIGGAKRIANMNLLKPSDIEATITQGAFSYQLKIINVIRVYPDRSSSYAVMSITRDADVWGSDYSMTPFDGGWLVQARLTDSTGTVLPLNPGPASIAVTSPTGKLVQIDGNYDGDLDNFNIEIIPGERRRGDSGYEQGFSKYAPDPSSFIVRPVNEDYDALNNIAGAHIEVTYPSDTYPTAGLRPRFVPVGADPNIQVMNSYIDNGDSTTTMRVDVLNPRGFYTLENRPVNGASLVQDMNLAIILPRKNHLSGVPRSHTDLYTLNTENTYFIDMDGDQVFPVALEMLFYTDL